ncbi:MlaD family protein [Kordiimonas lipolytica]|uniref:MlaD family protein n=1 Tax=Kordiimonas lipolytica TaxID=1662421 RepID=A0ABV8UCI1_9PROT|nr:MlaD family protein [Kordiimonas lipolytica]
METRASHILVGSFVLAFLAGLIAFAIWIAKVDLDAEYQEYDIFFDGSVSGLYKRSIVYYLGIPVGDVRDITLAPHDSEKVRVLVRLRSEVPVNEETYARLEFQGLTGVAYIEIKGSPQGSAPLKAKAGQERPVIRSEASPIQEVFETAPNLINEAILTVGQVKKMLAEENLERVSNILENTERATRNIADGTEDLDALMVEVREVMARVNETAAKLGTLADSGNKLLAEDGERLVAEAIETMNAAQAMLERVDALVAANEDSVTQFVQGSLPEVTRMIMDLRSTARSLSRLVRKIEQNPAETLLGPKESTYDLDARKVKETKE